MTYRDLHEAPELGLQEERTAARMTKELLQLDLRVIKSIGGHGLVGIFSNGPGRTILIRSELDALPVKEETGLSYASKVTMVDSDGKEKPVMHACGHDLNMTSLLAATALLVSAKAEWSGTLITLFQPNEERGAGAQAMVDDGLLDKILKPDFMLAQHNEPQEAGTLKMRSGPAKSAGDSFVVRVFGRGGHGGKPQECVDPVVMACAIVMRLQTLVSREAPPHSAVIITCSSLQAGDAENVIPDFADIKLNVRNSDLAVRKQILASIRRVIEAECEASNATAKPEFKPITSFPLTSNSPKVVERLRASFEQHFGAKATDGPLDTASEDFSNLATPGQTPYAYWHFGTIAPERWDKAQKEGKLSQLPARHSGHYAPDISLSLKTGTDAMALATLTMMRDGTI